ncbi:MAG: hypothetical protein FJ318_08980 [SAR202 cluster bacterium]|nr:hypothetical protein [SAR202 cluster bacterium]
MSRPIVNVKVQLPNGKTATGQGRDLLVAASRAYRQAAGDAAAGERIALVEQLERGHHQPGEARFEGTFHLRVTSPDGDERTLEVQARLAGG